ncbi:MAG TPA: type II toxin-antitoxin system VapC family toxin [Plasticicumulans sp.]|uniref:type II toxin-antitoxin system VapC family toxin n=1 Tax=Plasticicumulans sp. TaxID=2307179 RepID=UPI002C442B5C|nr:type II toxin-antitoxin system VapC family toxin [Plasticicumulans sp.]HND98281.1 type II toxin-antitoxin system VapC family toxin [Plasticicumulans sp.]HNE00448.1 type II toxin-antitoxin system VapC family toxin [Plasticicumulans sp.]
MRLLLDTHALLWWFAGDERLPEKVRSFIADRQNAVLVSAASIWEIATKHRLGKLEGVGELLADIDTYVRDQSFDWLDIAAVHALRAGLLPGAHRDPFDRMLIAQALCVEAVLVSNETLFDGFGVQRLWS